MNMSHRCSNSFAADHPSLAGHFPGNPIIPGVVILDAVRECLESWLPNQCIVALKRAKFFAPLISGQEFSIVLTRSKSTVEFRCTVLGELLATGVWTLNDRGEA